NYFVLVFMLMILYIMWNQGFMLSVLMLPVWILVLFVLFKTLKAKKS
ncbi:MAG: amino acid permease, partial [Acinetobacter sp.]|nr:amino acid permease [Acinetobacter sp.]